MICSQVLSTKKVTFQSLLFASNARYHWVFCGSQFSLNIACAVFLNTSFEPLAKNSNFFAPWQ